jgi:hypothetical protein
MTVHNLADIGEPNAPEGSPEWCKWAHHGLRIQKNDTQSRVTGLKYGLIGFKDDEHWKQLRDRTGASFLSWEDYVQCPEPFGLGMVLTIANAVMIETDDRRLLADVYRRADEQDRANQRPAHVHIKRDVYDNPRDIHVRPSGTSTERALRRLRKDRPDLHARVLAGEISANAGMIEAGFRKKRTSRRRSVLDRILKLLPQLTASERKRLRDALDQAREDA